MTGRLFRWTYSQVSALPGVVDVDGGGGVITLIVESWVDEEALLRYLDPIRLVGTIVRTKKND